MQRIVNLLGEQPISCHSALHVRGFERDDSVCEIEVFENLYVAQGRFNHRFRRRRAVLLQEVFFERAAVDANADRNFLRLSLVWSSTVIAVSAWWCYLERIPIRLSRRCERSEAIQRMGIVLLDCFVAWLLAMTANRA